MKRKIKLIFRLILVIILVVGLTRLLWLQLNYQKGNQEYQDALNIAYTEAIIPESDNKVASSSVDPLMKFLKAVNLKKLQESNEEIIGWIFIDDTHISYPIVQNNNNNYYLNHTWKKNYNPMGSIFMEHKCASDFSDFNTLIYGHNLNNDMMFSELLNYKDLEFYEQHPSVYIVTNDGITRYDIFAAYQAGIYTATYGLEISDTDRKQQFIQHSLENTVIDTGIVPDTNSKILTLSTCTANNASYVRWVVQAMESDHQTLNEI